VQVIDILGDISCSECISDVRMIDILTNDCAEYNYINIMYCTNV